MPLETHYAPAEKTDKKQLAIEIETIANNPLLDGLLDTVSGLIAVLNESRQIISLNDSFMRAIGVDNPEEAFGLRHGAALQCTHGEEEPAGCGTTEYCSTCGAAVAIVTSLSEGIPVEKICPLTIKKDGVHHTKAFWVKSHPVIVERNRFVLLFLQDITLQEQRAALERTFFHDINNLIYILSANSELLHYTQPSQLTQSLYDASIRITQEVAIQRCLLSTEGFNYPHKWQNISTHQIFEEIQTIFKNHPLRQNTSIEYENSFPDITVRTDISLLMRVLSNMVINALEAGNENEAIKIRCEKLNETISFAIWNPQEIPHNVTKRIFSRNYSTKTGDGRGLGTFSMKLFGEDYLGGKVNFETSKSTGTTFRLILSTQ